ncbi:hypothetical protein C8R44DRAFT_867005 [Mycena epipterygia]|nr:hypothetical protein C8R44DRAFT_867005 [Mycena epipterygia]
MASPQQEAFVPPQTVLSDAAIPGFMNLMDASSTSLLSFHGCRIFPHSLSSVSTPRTHRLKDSSAGCRTTSHASAPVSLTHFELVFHSDIPLRVVADIVSGLPRLTHLRLNGDEDGGIVQTEPVLPMDIDVWQNPSLLSYTAHTYAFQTHALAFTPGLMHLTLVWQYPITIPATLMLLSSVGLPTLTIGMRNLVPGPDWLLIDAIVVTPRFASLRRLSFMQTHRKISNTVLTAEVKALMPLACARGIFH